MCADEHSECWYCGQYILTLFLWTPRISQLAAVKDKEVNSYYKDAVDLLTETVPDFQPIKTGDVPHIIGPFSNWNYSAMREVIPFCQIYDKSPPDFKRLAVERKLLRPVCYQGKDSQPINKEEEKKL